MELISDKFVSYHLLVSSLELGRGGSPPAVLFKDDGVKQTFPAQGLHIVQEMDFAPANRFRPMRIRHVSSRVISLPAPALRGLGTNPSVRAFLLAVTLVMIWAALRAH
jgi:hypothetical protein